MGRGTQNETAKTRGSPSDPTGHPARGHDRQFRAGLLACGSLPPAGLPGDCSPV